MFGMIAGSLLKVMWVSLPKLFGAVYLLQIGGPSWTTKDIAAAMNDLGALYPVWFVLFIGAVIYVVDRFIHRND